MVQSSGWELSPDFASSLNEYLNKTVDLSNNAGAKFETLVTRYNEIKDNADRNIREGNVSGLVNRVTKIFFLR